MLTSVPTPVFSGCEKIVLAGSRFGFFGVTPPAAADVVDAIEGEGDAGIGRFGFIVLASEARLALKLCCWRMKWEFEEEDMMGDWF